MGYKWFRCKFRFSLCVFIQLVTVNKNQRRHKMYVNERGFHIAGGFTRCFKDADEEEVNKVKLNNRMKHDVV